MLKWTYECSVGILFCVGVCACLVTALPLGLDQMPDASSSSITSYIAWFCCIVFFERFLLKVFTTFDNMDTSIYLVLALIFVWAFYLLLIFFLAQNG